MDPTLEKVQKKNVDVMGLLSKLWRVIDSAASTSDDKTDYAIKALLNLIQQTVLLIG